MRLSVSNFPSGQSVQIQIINNTLASTVLAWTATGVGEQLVDAGAAKSVYYYDTTLILPDNQFTIMWKTGSAPPLTASETLSTLDTFSILMETTVVTDAVNSTFRFKTALTGMPTNFTGPTFVKFTSGALIGETRRISSAGYDSATGIFTLSENLTGIPQNLDRLKLVSQ